MGLWFPVSAGSLSLPSSPPGLRVQQAQPVILHPPLPSRLPSFFLCQSGSERTEVGSYFLLRLPVLTHLTSFFALQRKRRLRPTGVPTPGAHPFHPLCALFAYIFPVFLSQTFSLFRNLCTFNLHSRVTVIWKIGIPFSILSPFQLSLLSLGFSSLWSFLKESLWWSILSHLSPTSHRWAHFRHNVDTPDTR